MFLSPKSASPPPAGSCTLSLRFKVYFPFTAIPLSAQDPQILRLNASLLQCQLLAHVGGQSALANPMADRLFLSKVLISTRILTNLHIATADD
jgi:hypothetical protein